MSDESSDSPYRSPETPAPSSVRTPGTLGMFGAVVISLTSAGGVCCGSCWGVMFLAGFSGDFAFGFAICAAAALVTFTVVQVRLTNTIRAAREAEERLAESKKGDSHE